MTRCCSQVYRSSFVRFSFCERNGKNSSIVFPVAGVPISLMASFVLSPLDRTKPDEINQLKSILCDFVVCVFFRSDLKIKLHSSRTIDFRPPENYDFSIWLEIEVNKLNISSWFWYNSMKYHIWHCGAIWLLCACFFSTLQGDPCVMHLKNVFDFK